MSLLLLLSSSSSSSFSSSSSSSSLLLLLLLSVIAAASRTLASQRAGIVRVCDINEPGRGCRCTKPSECFDFTRNRVGVCDQRSNSCVYCLVGQHFEGNYSASFFSEALHRCVRSDSCEEIRNEQNVVTEVECVDGLCYREGAQTAEVCSCRDGYLAREMWDKKVRCADYNECEGPAKFNCSPRHCINTEGSFYCGCREGYRLVDEALPTEHCEEINECEEVVGICPQSCRNVPGTFNCTCHTGYMSVYEKAHMHCVDIDECQLAVCHPLMTCYNTIGSYVCTTPVQVPQTAGGWAITFVPIIIFCLILSLCCRNRILEQEITRKSIEDLAESGRLKFPAGSESSIE